MILDLTAIARRARVAVMVAGLAWLFGLIPPPGTRLAVVALVAAVIVFDAWLDQQQPHRPARVHPQRDHFHPVA